MSYIALYREWRPKAFSDIIGQEHITRTLMNQIRQGRIAHAYLFCGTRGTGKTTTAKVLAKAVNCLQPENLEPCGKCEICTGIDSGSIMDVIEIDAASNNGVDNIRELRDDVKYAPSKCKYKVYIIDEVHMLSTSAFNALLKTLEEPPAHVIFILATTESQKVPATILSRCQRFDFKRIRTSDIVGRLRVIADEDGINVEDRTLGLIARNSDGALRDALSIFDQCISLGGNDVKYDDVVSILGITTDEYLIKVADAIAEGDGAKCISLVDELTHDGKDIYQFIKDLTMHFRNLLVSAVNDNASDILNVSDELLQDLKDQSKKFSTEAVLRNINILSEAENEAKWSAQQRIVLEMALLKMTKKELQTDVSSLIDRISRLENILRSGTVTVESRQVREQPETKDIRKAEKVTEKVEKVTEKKDEAQVVDSGISLKDVLAKWKDILNAIKTNRYMTLYAYLMVGKPISLSGGVLTISFEKEYKIHKNNVENPESKGVIEDFISTELGQKIKIKCVLNNDEVAADKQGNDFIEGTIRVFGEDMVKVEE